MVVLSCALSFVVVAIGASYALAVVMSIFGDRRQRPAALRALKVINKPVVVLVKVLKALIKFLGS